MPTSQTGSEVRLMLLAPGAGGQPVTREFLFPLNPEDLTVELPARQQVYQTLGGAFVEHWGAALPTVVLRGHTGWRAGRGGQDGFQAFVALRDLYQAYLDQQAQQPPERVQLYLALTLPQGFGFFAVAPAALRVQRSARQPLLYRYELQAVVLRTYASSLAALAPAPAQPAAAPAGVDAAAAAAAASAALAAGFPPPLRAVVAAAPPGQTTVPLTTLAAQWALAPAALAQALGLSTAAQAVPAGQVALIPQELA